MQILNDLQNVDQELVLTIGTFDGVHRGHRSLLEQLVLRARQTARLSAALTFHPHPRSVLHPEMRPVYLSTPEERSEIIASLGIDLMVVLPFTEALACTPGEVFIRSLYDQLCMRELWVGPDFALGRDRAGDIETLRRLAGQLGYTLRLANPVYDEGQVISSTRIRQLLQAGDVAEAARLLGRRYAVTSVVQPGAQRGRALGFRTANLRLAPDRALPEDGVYAVWARVDGGCFQAVVNVGVRPTFDTGERLIEVHLLDYHGDLYGKRLTVEFAHRLRPEVRFPDGSALAAQISQDVARARELLGRAEDCLTNDAGQPPFEELEHTADVRLRVRGRNLVELFTHAAQGMFYLMRPEAGPGSEPLQREVVLDSVDLLSLLVDWLNELIYLGESNYALWDAYDIAILDSTHLEARVGGKSSYLFRKVIKAATFSDLSVEPTGSGYEATITFDV